MAKRRAKRRNPSTPTAKENLVTFITATGRDIFEILQDREIREGLMTAKQDDLNHLSKLSDNLVKWIYYTAGKVKL